MRRFKIDLLFGLLIVVVAATVIGSQVFALYEGANLEKVPETTLQYVEETTEASKSVEETTVVPETTVVEETTAPVETEAPKKYYKLDSLDCDTTSELDMLACVIYQEAGGNGSCDMCRYRVADVVLNRMKTKHWGDSMEDVLTAWRQYGEFYWTGIKWKERALNPGEADAVNRAYQVAEDVLINDNHSEIYGKKYIWQAEFEQGNSGFWCCGHYYGKN